MDHRRDRLRAYTTTPPGPAALRTAAQLGWCLATSEEHELADLPDAMAQAEELARTARHVGSTSWGTGRAGWTGRGPPRRSLGPDAAVARLLLDPVGEDDAEVRRALRTWLRENGSWDRAARALGIHRNTLRRLVGEAERLLERDLGDPLERARLVLAFAAVDGE
ncbi:helix-turn-helix domain-containing protein [Rothia sp. AR01]|uniref:Helix-turn-helix domain-containing protein n=1 Tax=Rothia santali TaxID=2949643 RepID=A0A9X2KIK2_9MICC|nr:helix-turn-helix domain-containing protein [Rothia santali]MCP3425919.1 helix-turn-helix domain-containing protein [Rothia santali]